MFWFAHCILYVRQFYIPFCVVFKNGQFPASFSLFPSFQCTVDSKQMFNINKFLLMTGFEPRTSGIGSDRSTNWATQPLPCPFCVVWTALSQMLSWTQCINSNHPLMRHLCLIRCTKCNFELFQVNTFTVWSIWMLFYYILTKSNSLFLQNIPKNL